MKALRYSTVGQPPAIEDIPVPDPTGGQVLL